MVSNLKQAHQVFTCLVTNGCETFFRNIGTGIDKKQLTARYNVYIEITF